MPKKPSLYGEERECWICHTPLDVELHHIYQGSRKPISDREGCTVHLCRFHHQDPRHGVHYDKTLMRFFKEDCQRRWERREGAEDHEAFRSIFYESYL